MSDPRNHHYIPQCYLRGFAVGSGKTCRLTVANIKERRFFETKPRNVGGRRDFNRVQIPGTDPNALETGLATFESQVAIAIRNVNESNRFEGEDRITILNLIALLAIRSPQHREHWRQFQEQVAKQIMSLALATKDRWEGQMRRMKAAGHCVNDDVTYEQIKAFHESGNYTFDVAQGHHIAMEFTGFEAVLPTLLERKWKLYTTSDDASCFVTTDRPVVLTWDEPSKLPAIVRHSPGHGMRGTEILFPLTQRATLIGRFDGEEGTEVASVPLVAGANLRMIEHAFEQVYTAKRTFPYFGAGPRLYNDRHFMERLAFR